MKITQVSASGFKGRSFTHELSELNLLTGPNAAGKTSRLDAIQLALCGYHPALAKTNQGIFTLASAETMSVTVKTDTGSTFARSWTEKKGKISESSTLDAAFIQNPIPVVLIDAASYFELSDRERVKYVFGLVKIAGAENTCESLVADLHEARIEGVPAQTQEAVTEMSLKLTRHHTASKVPVQEWLEDLLANLKQEQASLVASIKNMTGTVRGITELAQEVPKDVTKELAAARTQLEQLLKEQSQLEQEIAQASKLAKQRADLTADVAAIVVPEPSAINELTAQVAELEKCLLKAPKSKTDVLRATLKLAQQTRDKAYEEFADAGVERRHQEGLKDDRQKIKADIAALQQDCLGLPELEAELKRQLEAELEWSHGSRLSQKNFDTIAKSAQTLRDLVKLHDFTKKRHLEMTALADALECMALISRKPRPDVDSKLQNQIATKNNAQTALERSQARLATLGSDADLDAANQALASKKAIHEAAQTACGEAEAQVVAAEASDRAVRDWTTLLERRRKELASLMEAPNKRAELQKQIEALGEVQRYEDEYRAEAAWEGCQMTLRVRRAAISGFESLNNQWLRFKAEAATRAEAVKKRTKLESELAVTKAAVALVEIRQQSMVEDAFIDILKVANLVTEGILKSELCYRDGEIGMMQGQFVSHRTFSGTEQALAYAAMSVSLAVQSPLKLVLIDELGRLDAANKLLLVERLRQLLQSGTIDQCVLVDTSVAGYDVAGMTHIAL